MTGRQKMMIGWTILLFAPVFLMAAIFAAMEGYALVHEDAITLSQFTWEINEKWPLFLPLVCYIMGAIQWGFLVHILWHWSPKQGKKS